jgi:hypothetical protein
MKFNTLSHLTMTVLMLALVGVSACGPDNSSKQQNQQQQQLQDHSNPNPAPVPAGAKLEKEPQPEAAGGRLGASGLGIREGQIRTLHLGPGVVTNAKLAVSTVTVSIAGAATTGSSAADPTLVGSTILGAYGGGNLDKPINTVVVNADGSITVTLNAAATGATTVRVVVVRAFGA